MNKEKVYTLLTFTLSLMVIIAGWIFTKSMLKQKESSMLAQKGELYVDNSNLGVFDNDSNIVPGESDHENTLIVNHLSEKEIGEILAVWEMGGKELPHEPKTGQLDMEQAIDVGKNWVTVMAEQGIVPPELIGSDYDSVSAKLLSLETQAGLDEVMLSYWSVQFTKGDTAIRLTIHAVCGEIWRANITMKGDSSQLNEYSDEELLRMAFPFTANGESKKMKINSISYQSVGEGYVFAAVKRSETVVGEEAPVIQINLWLSSLPAEVRES